MAVEEKLGTLLVREKMISPEQLRKALEEQKAYGGRLGSSLTKLGFIKEEDLLKFLSREYGVPSVDLHNVKIDGGILKTVPRDFAKKNRLMPIKKEGATLTVAMSDPTNIALKDELRFLTGLNIQPMVAPDHQIQEAIERHYFVSETIRDVIAEVGADEMELVKDVEEIDLTDLRAATQQAPVIRFVNHIISDAVRLGASDIHVEPYEKIFRVRYRIDGVLHEKIQPPIQLKAAIVSRLKIMSNMDIAERRLPQDGRMKMRVQNREIDFRISMIPTVHGEKVVMRLLDKDALQVDMTKLGFEKEHLDVFKKAIAQPWGMVLITGPTGSGKTTTLYSAVQELNKVNRNILTAEDPVEYNFSGINQVQINEDIGLTFAACIRAFMRQDPNIILVGEIRDYETAETAIKAALTGHLVLSTLHTNDAPTAVTRLLNMGIEPFLIVSTLHLVGAQRLIRKICQECKEPEKVSPEILGQLGIPKEKLNGVAAFKGKGCRACNGMGYKGRLALYELLPLSDPLRELILQGAASTEVKREAIKEGMKSLRQAALQRLLEGTTTMEEVLRVTLAD
ncbi:MAG: type IV-A pilus assembly ATPase PilB [Nitrospirae bacterium]|nr:type IV-A pilus assembly ATPase PilB [Nitrospirota bacterium]